MTISHPFAVALARKLRDADANETAAVVNGVADPVQYWMRVGKIAAYREAMEMMEQVEKEGSGA